MTRLSGVIWVLVILASAFGVYAVKYRVQSVINQVDDTSRQLAAEKQALHVARAEWAYLNRPERLRQLAERYLSDADLTAAQFASVKNIPLATTQVASVRDNVNPASMTIVK